MTLAIEVVGSAQVLIVTLNRRPLSVQPFFFPSVPHLLLLGHTLQLMTSILPSKLERARQRVLVGDAPLERPSRYVSILLRCLGGNTCSVELLCVHLASSLCSALVMRLAMAGFCLSSYSSSCPPSTATPKVLVPFSMSRSHSHHD